MNVSELIAMLQNQHPKAEVVIRDHPNELSFVRVRKVDTVVMRASFRKGMGFLGSWDEDWSHPDGRTEVMREPVHGVLLE